MAKKKSTKPKQPPRSGWLARLKRRILPPDRIGTMIQTEPHTALDRYPQVFQACADFAKERGWDAAPDFRILSFGCSTGEECVTLANYFPSASILGIDVNEPNLRQAQKDFGTDKVRFALSNEKVLGKNGPFHIVFCMSVLCHWPGAKTMEDISGIFPFARFEEALELLHPHLHPGGLLVIYNSNFCLRDSVLRHHYRVVHVDALRESGFVHKFSREGRKLHDHVYDEVLFEKIPAAGKAK